jgi:hypothetical protein
MGTTWAHCCIGRQGSRDRISTRCGIEYRYMDMNLSDDHLPVPPPAPLGLAGPISEPPVRAVPWDGNEGGWLGRWWETLVMVLFRPGEFFARVRAGGRLDRAILFFAIGLVVESIIAPLTTGQVETSIASRLIERLLPSADVQGLGLDGALNFDSLLPSGKPPGTSGHSSHRSPSNPGLGPVSQLLPALQGVFSLAAYVFSIVLGFASLFATAGLFQAGAWIFIPRRRPFGDTLRAVAYAHAPLVWALVPVVGDIVFVIWLSVLIVIGLRVVHETTKARVVAALSFWPTLILLTVGVACCLMVGQLMSVVNR